MNSASSSFGAESISRDEYLARRGQIEGLRLADEDAIRKADAVEKAAEIEKLKAEAREEVRRLEARANKTPLAGDQAAAAVEWWDETGDKMTGTLLKINCLGREFQLELKDEKGVTKKLMIRDRGKIAVTGGEMTFSCGVQKPRSVTVTSRAGEVTAIELK